MAGGGGALAGVLLDDIGLLAVTTTMPPERSQDAGGECLLRRHTLVIQLHGHGCDHRNNTGIKEVAARYSRAQACLLEEPHEPPPHEVVRGEGLVREHEVESVVQHHGDGIGPLRLLDLFAFQRGKALLCQTGSSTSASEPLQDRRQRRAQAAGYCTCTRTRARAHIALIFVFVFVRYLPEIFVEPHGDTV